jgi:hypothetical protein
MQTTSETPNQRQRPASNAIDSIVYDYPTDVTQAPAQSSTLRLLALSHANNSLFGENNSRNASHALPNQRSRHHPGPNSNSTTSTPVTHQQIEGVDSNHSQYLRPADGQVYQDLLRSDASSPGYETLHFRKTSNAETCT